MYMRVTFRSQVYLCGCVSVGVGLMYRGNTCLSVYLGMSTFTRLKCLDGCVGERMSLKL